MSAKSKVGKFGVKFPFDGFGYFVTLTHPEFSMETMNYIDDFVKSKFEFVLGNVEYHADGRPHYHVIISDTSSQSTNINKKFKALYKRLELVVASGVSIKVKKITKTVHNVVGYVGKDSNGEYRVMKGFTTTWIDDQLKLYNARKAKCSHQKVSVDNCYDQIEIFAKAHQMAITSVESFRDIMVAMNIEAYVFVNPRKCVEVIKQRIASMDEGCARDFWNCQFNLMN